MNRIEPPVLRVLCVDDNRDAADSLGILLELAGFESQVCYDGMTALNLIESYRPDACIIDLNMPGMDGDELARRIREKAPGRMIPMVAVTAMGDKESRDRTSEAGFGLHLTKPIDPDRLANVLADIVILRGDPSWCGEETMEAAAPGFATQPKPQQKKTPLPPGLFSSHGFHG